MDHAIDFLRDYMSYDEEEFIKEWKSGNYTKISDCPSYEEIKAYCNAINELQKYYNTIEDYEKCKILPSTIIKSAN